MSRSIWRMRRARLGALTGAVALLMALLPATAASAAPPQTACDNRDNNTYSKLLECVRVGEVREHQAALQAIADANGGTRAAGTPGYDASVDYVVDTLEAAGWSVSLDEFPFLFFPPPTLQQLTPVNAVYETGVFTGSGFGTVTGNVIPVDINLVPPRASTSGCEAGDFTGDWSGTSDIALDPEGHVHVRRKGDQRPECRCRSGDHLQPGQHPGPRRTDRGYAAPRRRRSHHPRGGRVVRQR